MFKLVKAALGLAMLLGVSMSAQSAQTPAITTSNQPERVFVAGEVVKPSSYALVNGMTVAQLVALAGGF